MKPQSQTLRPSLFFSLLLILAPLGAAQGGIFPELLTEIDTLPSAGLFWGSSAEGAIGTNGDTVVVGSRANSQNATVWVYREDETGDWVLIDPMLQPPDTGTRNSDWGRGVDLDGDRLIVGGSQRAMTLLQNAEGKFDFEFAPAVPSANVVKALSGDTMVVCCSSTGAVVRQQFGRVFQRDAQTGVWSFLQNLSPLGNFFIRIDGDTMISANDPGSGTNGTGIIFERDSEGVWAEVARNIKPGPGNSEWFGAGLDIEGDLAVFGAGEGNAGAGIAYAYERVNGTWGLSHTFFPPDIVISAQRSFGASVAIDEGLVFIGNPSASNFRGAVYVYEKVGENWVQRTVLRPSTGSLMADTGGLAVANGLVAMSGSGAAALFRENSDPSAVVAALRSRLFVPDAVAAGKDPERVPFRFAENLYEGDSIANLRAATENVADLYGPDEVAETASVLAKLLEIFDPGSDEHKDLWLDIVYYRTLAAQILASERRADADLVRLDFLDPANPPAQPSPGTVVIDAEIAVLEDVVDRLRLALHGSIPGSNVVGGYPDLLQDASGYAAFEQRVPLRALEAPELSPGVPIVDCNEDEVLDTLDAACSTLFDGHRDLVLALGVLRDLGRAVAELAELYHRRNSAADRNAAETLIEETQALLFLQGELLLGVFPALDPPMGDPSGLAEAVAAWRSAIALLGTTRQLLAGNSNALGFEEGFLLFIDKQGGIQSFDTFDIFRDILDPSAPGTNALGTALEELDLARTQYATYQGFQDQVKDQFTDISSRYDDRLREIAGVRRGQPGYNDPVNNAGGEIWQQIQTIQVAQNAVRANREEILNLKRRVQIEIHRRAREENIMDAIEQVHIDHGEFQAELTETIGHIEAVQALSSGIVETLDIENLTTGKAFVGVANAAVQAGAEEVKGQLEADKERLAGLAQGLIVSLENRLLDVNSRALIKTWMLDMSTLAIDSESQAILLRQEVARLKALFDEQADIEARMDAANEGLAGRYFADPSHRLVFNNQTLRAHLAFRDAQRWLFFMIRSAEYKWNQQFSATKFGRAFTSESVFALRNARELEDLYLALLDFDFGRPGFEPDVLDVISLRKDVFGYIELDEENQPILYDDPRDPESQVDAIAAFRSLLQLLADESGIGLPSLRFSTAQEFPNTNLFVGPIYLGDGSVFAPGTTLDKIKWLVVQIPGNHTSNALSVPGLLRYGGASYIRSSSFPLPRSNGARPDRISCEISGDCEMTPFGTQRWHKKTDVNNGEPLEAWRASEPQRELIQMNLNRTAPTDCNESSVIDIFQERSVAASEWELTLQPNPSGLRLDEVDDIELWICHRWHTRD